MECSDAQLMHLLQCSDMQQPVANNRRLVSNNRGVGWVAQTQLMLSLCSNAKCGALNSVIPEQCRCPYANKTAHRHQPL
eukprot:scaffold42035_cov14-Tisochrysis_lutea.AAC.1